VFSFSLAALLVLALDQRRHGSNHAERDGDDGERFSGDDDERHSDPSDPPHWSMPFDDLHTPAPVLDADTLQARRRRSGLLVPLTVCQQEAPEDAA
jgi:hypothetical protein